MKQSIIVSIIALILLPSAVIAQKNVLEKYSDNPNVTYVSIKPKMFQMIAKMGIDEDDAEAKAYMDMVKSITSFKTIITDNSEISYDVSNWVKSRSGELEELMEVKEDGKDVRFYVKEGKDVEHVRELLIFVSGINTTTGNNIQTSTETRKIETVLVSLTGDINLNEISKLTDKMNIPGGKYLNK